MLMNIKCSAVTSVRVDLSYDDGSVKNAVIAENDLIDVIYNANGMRKRACGRVLLVSANGPDPKNWYIIVDGSDDFDANKARFCPMSILELEIISKGDNVDLVRTIKGDMGVPYLRIVKGRLQWSKDAVEWYPINIDREDIMDQEGTVPMPPHGGCTCPDSKGDDGIEDAEW